MTRTIAVYASYNFKDKDPIIDSCRTIIADEGATYQDIHIKSGVSMSTLHGWFNGATKRPQFATIMAVTRCLGYDLAMVKRKASGAKIIQLKMGKAA